MGYIESEKIREKHLFLDFYLTIYIDFDRI